MIEDVVAFGDVFEHDSYLLSHSFVGRCAGSVLMWTV